MTEPVTLEVTTYVYGLGTTRTTPPVYVLLTEHTLTARDLIAEHVRAEVTSALHQHTRSLALHYLFADDLRSHPEPAASTSPTLDVAAEIQRACDGLREQRYLLVVDGKAVEHPDMVLTVTEQSQVNFIRLLPLIGG